jgi:hypothetical protein
VLGGLRTSSLSSPFGVLQLERGARVGDGGTGMEKPAFRLKLGLSYAAIQTHPFFRGVEIASVYKVIWWARRDSNPRPPRCEQGKI